MNDLEAKVEALLFALGRPLSYDELAKKLGISKEELKNISYTHSNRGVVIVDDGKTLELRVAGNAASLIEEVRKEEYSRDVGRAGLEALSAILYRGPLTRAEIDFIRGVNSSQTLRTLTMRGLVRKIANPKDERSFLYEPTTELMAELGVSRLTELPEYETLREKLKTLEESYRARESSEPQ